MGCFNYPSGYFCKHDNKAQGCPECLLERKLSAAMRLLVDYEAALRKIYKITENQEAWADMPLVSGIAKDVLAGNGEGR